MWFSWGMAKGLTVLRGGGKRIVEYFIFLSSIILSYMSKHLHIVPPLFSIFICCFIITFRIIFRFISAYLVGVSI